MDTNQIKRIIYGTTIGFLAATLIGFMAWSMDLSRNFLFISGLWLIASVLLYVSIKSDKNVMIVIFLNVFMAGMTMAAYYSDQQMDYFKVLISGMTFLMAMAIEYFVLINANNKKKVIKYYIFFIGTILVFWFFRWLGGDIVLASSMSFACIVIFCMNIGINEQLKRKEELRILSVMKLTSMLIFGGILLLIIVALTEGNIFDLPYEMSSDKKRLEHKL